MTAANTADTGEDVTGFTYCPPGWTEQRLREGQDAEAITRIALETYTDIAYIKDKNAIQIIGESHDDVYKAQTQLNSLFFPVIVKSKRQWARPDRPGSWGQRRDSGNSGLRRMKSESALRSNYPEQQQQQQQQQQPYQPPHMQQHMYQQYAGHLHSNHYQRQQQRQSFHAGNAPGYAQVAAMQPQPLDNGWSAGAASPRRTADDWRRSFQAPASAGGYSTWN